MNCATRMTHFGLVLLCSGPVVRIMADGLTIDHTDAGNIAEPQSQVPDTAQQSPNTELTHPMLAIMRLLI